MSNDNKNKGLETLQSKLNAHEFEFDDQMWEKMEIKLNKEVGLLATWREKVATVLSLTTVRWSVILLLVGGSIYFFTTPAIEANLLSNNTISSLPVIANTKGNKTNNTSASTEKINSTENISPTQTTQKKVASNFDKNFKNTPKGATETISTSTQNRNIYSKNSANIVPTNKPNISTDGANSTEEKQNLIAKEDDLNDKEELFAYTKNSSSTDALVVEEIPSLLTNISNTKTVINFKPPTLSAKSSNHFGVTAGYLFNTTSPKVHINDNIYLGVILNRNITAKWCLGLTIGIKNVRLSNPIEFDYQDIIIAPTGKAILQLSKKNSKFQFLESSISLQYMLPASKSAFKLGLRSSYILQDLEKKISSHTMGFNYNYPASKAANVKKVQATDYYGIRRFNFGIMVGYQYQINNKWSVGLDYTQGLIDISKNEIFSDEKLHKNTDLQVGITYWIR